MRTNIDSKIEHPYHPLNEDEVIIEDFSYSKEHRRTITIQDDSDFSGKIRLREKYTSLDVPFEIDSVSIDINTLPDLISELTKIAIQYKGSE